MKLSLITLAFVAATCAPDPAFASVEPTLLDVATQAIKTGPDRDVIARAIVVAVQKESDEAPLTGSHAEDVALLGVFVRHESGGNIVPNPVSWDAKLQISNGPWQMPANVARLPLATQARTWLHWAKKAGVAGLCGHGEAARRIAEQRTQEARAVLAAALAAR
jgi:hypothetical protein